MSFDLNYRTFDQLMVDVYADLPKAYQDDMIRPEQLIKVVQRVNYELGLRINQTKEAVVELDKGRVRLPLDFYKVNYAFICGEYEIKTPAIQGTHVEEKPLGVPDYKWQPDSVNTCVDPEPPKECSPCPNCNDAPCGCNSKTCDPSPRACTLNCKGEAWELVQYVKYDTYHYKELLPIRFLDSSQGIDCECANLYMTSPNTAWIKDGWLYSNLKSGKIYLNYQGLMEDTEGNLLVVDHPMLNEFYEYALKSRIFENMALGDEPNAGNKLQLIESRLRTARVNAISIARMPNFAELKKVYESNRKSQYNKYYAMFSGNSWFDRSRYSSSGNRPSRF